MEKLANIIIVLVFIQALNPRHSETREQLLLKYQRLTGATA